jgi:hypothetical protein
VRRRIAPLVLSIALLAAGCGGPIRADELQRGIESLGALAAEGAVLADGVAGDRTKATFTRVQARTLGEEADHEAEKLSDAAAPAGLESAKADAVSLAQDVGDALGELQVAPGDAEGARSTGETLRRLRDRADELAGGL